MIEIIKRAVYEGPVTTTIISEDPDPLGLGVFEVKVTARGIEIRPGPIMRSAFPDGDWKAISFSELRLFDIQNVIRDCDYLLGQYENDARDRIAQLQQKLEDVRRALATEVRVKARRKSMRIIP